MTSLPRAEVEASLCRKGFEESRDGDHRYFKLMCDGKYTGIQTKTSHGTKYKDLGAPLVAAMARQIKLGKSEFLDFVQCSLSQKRYFEILRKKGEL